MMIANASTATTTGSTGVVTLYLNNGGLTDFGCGAGVTAPPGLVGSLENNPSAFTDIGSPYPTPEYCTSTSGAYSGPTLSITQVTVTLYVESNGVTDVLNSTLLTTQPSGAVLASRAILHHAELEHGDRLHRGDLLPHRRPRRAARPRRRRDRLPVCELWQHTP